MPYGRLNRVRRSIGVFLKNPPTVRQWPAYEIIRGLQWGAASLRTNVLLTQVPPQEWSSEMFRDLSGVLVFPSAVTRTGLESLGQMKIPTLLAWETELPGQRIDFNQVASARLATERLLLGGHDRIAFITGFEKSLDELKKAGALEAWMSVGKAREKLFEFAVREEEQNLEEVFTKAVQHDPSFTAVITADDGIGIRFVDYLHSFTAIRVPETMSVVSFHRSPFLSYQGPFLSTVDFDFFEAGKRAAHYFLFYRFFCDDELKFASFSGRLLRG